MKRSGLLITAIIVLVLINIGTLSFLYFNSKSQRPPHGPRGEGPKHIIIERLHFSKTQQDEYEILIKDHRSKSQELNEMSRELHNELFSLLKNDSGYKQIVDSLIERISINQKDRDNLNFDHFQKIKALCKGEQIQLFNDLAEDLAKLFAPEGPSH